MATPEEITDILKTLASAYPDRKLPKETYQLYISSLVDLPNDLLRLAMFEHIERSAWFPRIADLRAIAQREIDATIRNMHANEPGTPLHPHTLIAKEIELVAAFCDSRDLDESAWTNLINGFSAIGYEQAAYQNRQRLAYFKQLIEEENEELE